MSSQPGESPRDLRVLAEFDEMTAKLREMPPADVFEPDLVDLDARRPYIFKDTYKTAGEAAGYSPSAITRSWSLLATFDNHLKLLRQGSIQSEIDHELSELELFLYPRQRPGLPETVLSVNGLWQVVNTSAFLRFRITSKRSAVIHAEVANRFAKPEAAGGNLRA